jgi:hypothetical protein
MKGMKKEGTRGAGKVTGSQYIAPEQEIIIKGKTSKATRYKGSLSPESEIVVRGSATYPESRYK